MKTKFLLVLCLVPFASYAAERTDSARVGVTRASMAAMRGPNVTNINTATPKPITAAPNIPVAAAVLPAPVEMLPAGGCRDAYRACMDEFCLLDESEGARCACSENINQSKSLIQEIQKIQSEADELYTTGVEREKLGASAALVFGTSDAAKKASRASGLSFTEWLRGGNNAALGADAEIGENLYYMASDYCAAQLDACDVTADMEAALYSRLVTTDCKNFEKSLAEQKRNAQANVRTAQAAVRAARLSMLDTTNKYNRGECLIAYKSCIADKGGCGANFENCLDAALLGRRANACENVLEQCMAVRDYVVADWAAESKTILADAAKYADRNRRLTCMAKIQFCLEDGCAKATDSACLTNVNVAAGICPIIDECNAIIPGIKTAVNDKLGFLGVQFCQNDVNKCLTDKCGADYSAPECLGKRTSEITALCPQELFPSCRGEEQFDIIVQSALLEMDYAMLQGCVNYFGTQLGNVCGTDMACLPESTIVANLTTEPNDVEALRDAVRAESAAAVNEFFTQFQKDVTVAACMDSKKVAGRKSLGDSVFTSAKMVAEISAENRAMRALDSKLASLTRVATLQQAEEKCLTDFAVETPKKDNKRSYSYIRSVSFEPALSNCHVCRMQQVCETGGESKGAAGVKGLAGGLAAGASAGTMVSPGWGTAIGAVVGGVGGLFAGRSGAGEQTFCQEIESCEDINIQIITINN